MNKAEAQLYVFTVGILKYHAGGCLLCYINDAHKGVVDWNKAAFEYS